MILKEGASIDSTFKYSSIIWELIVGFLGTGFGIYILFGTIDRGPNLVGLGLGVCFLIMGFVCVFSTLTIEHITIDKDK